MKTKEQIQDVTTFLPIGMILEVPRDFISDDYLDLNGQIVSKKDYPKLAEVLSLTPFDKGDNLEMISEEHFRKSPGVSFTVKHESMKLVMRVK